MIAISYRREDSLPIAGRLYDRLQAKFGKKNVFMDFDSIPPGADFRQHIKQMIERSNLVIAIIGPHWLGEQPDVSRRIDNPADFVRLEIAYALEGGIPVIPLLINTTQMPKPEMLPPDIQELAFRHALPLDSGMDFHSHTDRLITGIHKAMAGAPRSVRPQKIVEPTSSAVSRWSLRKIVICSTAILLAGAASAVWFLTAHWHEQKADRTRQALAIEQPKPAKAEPPVSPMVSPSDRTWQTRLNEFVKHFVLVNQSKDEAATLAMYAPIVDYFDEGQRDEVYISRDIEKYNKRWPVRHDEIEGDINIEEKTPDREYAASFKLNFYVESLLHTEWAKGQFVVYLGISVVDDELKVSGIKEKMVRKEDDTAKTTAALTSGAVMSPSPPIAAQPPSPQPVAAATPHEIAAQKLTKVFVKKYGFSVLLPTELFPDAATKLADDKIDRIESVKGCASVAFNLSYEPVRKAYDNCITEFRKEAKDATIDYKVVKDTWFVVSGGSNTTGYYTKGVKRGDNVVIMQLEYKGYKGSVCNIPNAMLTEMSHKFDGN